LTRRVAPRPRLAALVALVLLPAIALTAPAEPAAPAETAAPAKPAEAIAESFEARERITRTGMWTLGGWAVANSVVSGIMYFTGPGDRAFHEMNVMWNTVNLGLAASALISGINAEPPASVAEDIRAQHRLEKTLLLNAGLDTGYVMVGFFLRQYAKTSGEPRYSGWGTSLILQGGFLFAFDVVLAVLQSRNRAYEAALPAAE
jgi:hypothetical protein